MSYVCINCRRLFRDFRLSCPECGGWRTFTGGREITLPEESRPVPLPEVIQPEFSRVITNVHCVDTLLGGGFVRGSSVLLIGPPGAGKSTLLLQLFDRARLPGLYVTGEESIQQLKLRATRLNINAHTIALFYETDVNKILAHLNDNVPVLLVIDSIQTIYAGSSSSLPGTPTQIRRCAYLLRRASQEKEIVLVMIGQITKEKKAAGPKLLEHAVDVVLYLDADDGGGHHRVLQVTKNRFGPTSMSLSLRMTESGFQFPERKP